ncbi:pirin family protein [Thiofilum flexile]|uniref:pirin family protein n=1 Tax=Thiofilum flexile TaxID=125627 RepID=UPI000379CD01|nr:pirin family protein [Thiofilum flexile]
MIEVRLAKQRGAAEHGWLSARHTFSFGHYYDPKQLGFSDLLVINDDRVQPSRGFGTHGHRDMEIFTYILEGALEHKDSMGTGSVIRPGDVQMMSAGSGIQHSEFNHSAQALVHLLQIWIIPNRKSVTPRYQQVNFSESEKRGQLRLIISPEGENGSLSVYQDARVYAGLFNGEEQSTLTLAPERYAYIHIAQGSVEVNGIRLNAGDGARVRDETALHFSKGDNAEVLVFDLRPQELPEMI